VSYYYNEAGEKTPLTEDVLALFQPKMTSASKRHYFEWIQTMMSSFPFEYMLASGTLIGSLVYEGFIPWDDDFDIFCHWEDYDKIKHWTESKMNCHWHNINPLVNSSEEFQITKISPQKPLRCFQEQNYPWGWPSLDIFWLHKTDHQTRKRFFKDEEHPLADLYPTKMGRFEGQSFCIPQGAEKVIVQKYPHGLVHAIPPWYDHQEEKHLASFRHILVPLRNLAPIYPILNTTLPKLESMGYIDTKSINLS
jgi:hypothetical protein